MAFHKNSLKTLAPGKAPFFDASEKEWIILAKQGEIWYIFSIKAILKDLFGPQGLIKKRAFFDCHFDGKGWANGAEAAA